MVVRLFIFTILTVLYDSVVAVDMMSTPRMPLMTPQQRGMAPQRLQNPNQFGQGPPGQFGQQQGPGPAQFADQGWFFGRLYRMPLLFCRIYNKI